MKRVLFTIAMTMAACLPPAAWSKDLPAAPFAVGPQYDTTHVYVAEADFDRFVASVLATFGGSATKAGEFQVTPTKSLTKSQLVLTPVGTLSVFGFKTPVPYPFGSERNGYLVTDIDQAVGAAVRSGAVRRTETFPDPIGRDVVVQWPGGIDMQLYWHTTKPSYPALATVPENRVYLTPDAADRFIGSWQAFAKARIVADERNAQGDEVGQDGKAIRRVALDSGYGRMVVFVTNGQLPWPYGREITGYAVPDLQETLTKATAAGVETLVAPHAANGRHTMIVRFPGGYIAEIHSGPTS